MNTVTDYFEWAVDDAEQVMNGDIVAAAVVEVDGIVAAVAAYALQRLDDGNYLIRGWSKQLRQNLSAVAHNVVVEAPVLEPKQVHPCTMGSLMKHYRCCCGHHLPQLKFAVLPFLLSVP